jgi:tRNA-dihydrouridine synthase A
MMAWTDRHCRYLHRLCSPNARLFTEMVTTGALLHGPTERLLHFDPAEHPVAIQLGGSDPAELASAARLAEQAGFDEINLNVGCPSPRVRRGSFGACLMREPALVADCVTAMGEACSLPVTVKCRLGVDDADSDPLLDRFIDRVAGGGCGAFYLHARKALLSGLSPAQNREVPPLQYARVYRAKARRPDLEFVINGGITGRDDALAHLGAGLDGVMIGRAAYHNPLLLAELDAAVHGTRVPSAEAVMAGYIDYVGRELAAGTRLHDMTRHVLGLFNGIPGARRYRQILSDAQRLRHNDIGLVHDALAALRPRAA